MKTGDLAEYLQVSKSTVRKRALRGDLPGFKPLGSGPRASWRFDPEEIEDLRRTKGVR
jgi:excisionase family DNA binding protein